MSKISENLLVAGIVGGLAGAFACAATCQGRLFSKMPQLPHTNAFGTAGGVFVSTFLVMSLISEKKISDNSFIPLSTLGGIALSTAANKYWGGKELSVLSNAVTPTISGVVIASIFVSIVI
ncbi:MAG: hypothetical protein H7A38_03175 [Chlamydiales bacterium]|nr:hypothetical protein [Chlamydiales bacterium]